MAKVFLTKEEAIQWGIIKPRMFDTHKMREKVVIRVLAGIIVFLMVLLLSVGGPQAMAVITTVTN